MPVNYVPYMCAACFSTAIIRNNRILVPHRDGCSIWTHVCTRHPELAASIRRSL